MPHRRDIVEAMVRRDTSAAALRTQAAALRRLTASERARIAFELSEATRDVARAGVAARHPDYDTRFVELALLRLLHGDETFRRVWPGEPLLPA